MSVRFTTIPTEVNKQGIPVAAKEDGTVSVQRIWGGTLFPLLHLTTKNSVFWEKFFVWKLMKVKQRALEEALAAGIEADKKRDEYHLLSSVIP